MSDLPVISKEQIEDLMKSVANGLNNFVFPYLESEMNQNPQLRNTLNPAFPFPREIRIGILDNCLAVEHIGPDDPSSKGFTTQGIWKPGQDLFDFLGMDISHLKPIQLEHNSNIENMSFFLGDSITYLCDYFYDFVQNPQDVVLNGIFDFSNLKNPVYISNCNFFWTDSDSNLQIRRVDFLEIFPRLEEGWPYHSDNSFEQFRKFLLSYQVPRYNTKLHETLNNFIELINLPNTTEPQITNFLEKNPEILQLAFGAHGAYSQIPLKWQIKTNKDDLKPDFLLQRMDSFADLLEFKLPKLKGNPMVGSSSRRQPSFEVDSAIAQLDDYEEWCSQLINREWLEKEHKIKILHPQRFLIMGHSSEFDPQDRQRLRSKRDTAIFTYDEFINLVRFQLYRLR